MASKPIRKGSEDRRIFVGNWKKPIAIIKRGEIKNYIDDYFFSYYECWRIFNAGLGLPYGEKWAEYPERFVNMISIMESEWRALTNAN